MPEGLVVPDPSLASATEARRPVRLMLLVSSLEHGGAERQVVELARNLDPSRFDALVCSLSPVVPLADRLPDRSRQLAIVPKRWRYDVSTVGRVARLMSRERVQIVHSFLFDADMVARLAARVARVPVVIASERNSDYERPLLHKLCLRLTRSWSDALIANSHAGARFVTRTLGIPKDRIHVVHNGVDTARFQAQDRLRARLDLGIEPDRPVVGMIASLKPQKNHPMFLEMAQRVLGEVPDALFLCVGERLRGSGRGRLSLRSGTGAHRGVEEYCQRVVGLIQELGLSEHVRLLGRVEEPERVYGACDVTVLTSLHEGTPNVLLESMACQVPVVATDVADNRYLIAEGRVGFVVPRGDAGGMANHVAQLLLQRGCRDEMGAAARAWVEAEFSPQAMARKTENVYEELLRRKEGGWLGAGRRGAEGPVTAKGPS